MIPRSITPALALLALASGLGAQTPTVHFTAGGNFALSQIEPRQILVDDFNQDGHADLLVSTAGLTGAGRMNLFLGDGHAGFGGALEVGTHSSWALAKGDFNGDGIVDVVSGEADLNGKRSRVFLNDGLGNLTQSAVLISGDSVADLAVGDFDGDGKLDIAIAGRVGNPGIVVYIGHGDGTFTGPMSIGSTLGFHADSLAAGDFDGDGLDDLVSGSTIGAVVFRSFGGGVFNTFSLAGPSTAVSDVAVADLDGDGVLDIVTLDSSSAPGSVHVCHGNGDATFTTIHDYLAGPNANHVAIADLTHDGIPDLAVACSDGNQIALFLGTGGAAFLPAQNLATGSGPVGVGVGDWNEDGLLDLAAPLRNQGGPGSVSIFTQDIPAPSSYCSAKTNSQGCTPAIGSSGTPSASSSAPFLVTASQVLNQKTGLLLYGYAQGSTPFQGGTLCISGGIKRTPAQNSGGNSGASDCSGTFAFDMNARTQSGIDPGLRPGIGVDAQYWYRDPADAFHTGLSDGLHFVIGP
jgi:hypothetical protein